MRKMLRKNLKFLIVIVIMVIFYAGGYFDIMRETSFEQFTYPLEENIRHYVEKMREGQLSPGPIINEYRYTYLIDPIEKCRKDVRLDLVFVVKSGLDNFERREAIRRTWGDEAQFRGKEIRRFFMVGVRNSRDLQRRIDSESEQYNDLIQADFLDAYYNNTIKTMMSFKWLLKNCRNSKFHMFVDDDYYVSMKNVLRYIEDPTGYPKRSRNITEIRRFYSGNCVPTRPMRDFLSKYRLSLEEYPYDKFPLYSTAGAYILSSDALEELFYASFFTKHFRFDDVYLGILSRKMGISPYHTKYIAGEWRRDNEDFERHCLASHGFEDTEKMLKLWTQQKKLGYA